MGNEIFENAAKVYQGKRHNDATIGTRAEWASVIDQFGGSNGKIKLEALKESFKQNGLDESKLNGLATDADGNVTAEAFSKNFGKSYGRKGNYYIDTANWEKLKVAQAAENNHTVAAAPEPAVIDKEKADALITAALDGEDKYVVEKVTSEARDAIIGKKLTDEDANKLITDKINEAKAGVPSNELSDRLAEMVKKGEITEDAREAALDSYPEGGLRRDKYEELLKETKDKGAKKEESRKVAVYEKKDIVSLAGLEAFKTGAKLNETSSTIGRLFGGDSDNKKKLAAALQPYIKEYELKDGSKVRGIEKTDLAKALNNPSLVRVETKDTGHGTETKYHYTDSDLEKLARRSGDKYKIDASDIDWMFNKIEDEAARGNKTFISEDSMAKLRTSHIVSVEVKTGEKDEEVKAEVAKAKDVKPVAPTESSDKSKQARSRRVIGNSENP